MALSEVPKCAHASTQPVAAHLSGGTNIAAIIQPFDLMPHDRRKSLVYLCSVGALMAICNCLTVKAYQA